MHARDLGPLDDAGVAGDADAGAVAAAGLAARSDDAIRADLLRLVECYSGEPGAWEVRVAHGKATVRRSSRRPGPASGAERFVVRALAHTVTGVISVRVPLRPARPAAVGVPA